MSRDVREEYWIDMLWEKHEYFTFTAREKTVKLDGQPVRLLLPEYTPAFTVKAWATRGALLFLVCQLELRFAGERIGAIIVARRTAEGAYATVVWHELYPHALKHLALTDEEV